jgi:hypothetical protein
MSLGLTADACPSATARSLGLIMLLSVVSQSGCTALLTTTALRDAVPGASDPADDEMLDEPESIAGDGPATGMPDDDEPLVLAKPAVSMERTIEQAIERLAAAGRMDEPTQSALIGMLEQTPAEDWPAIIDAFVEALEAGHVAAKPVTAATSAPPPEPAPPPAPLAPATLAAPAIHLAPAIPLAPPPETRTPAAAPATAAMLLFPVVEPVAALEPVAEPTPSLHIDNACFASRVRGWGQVDRFETSLFRAGQDVIVYFELENLQSLETDAGHRTEVDTSLRLVTEDGHPLHAWSFDPVEETCPARRRDYFIRYVLRLPADLEPGTCRLDVTVTDAVGNRTATVSLPLEIVAR